MLVAELTAPRQLRIVEHEIGPLHPGEVRVRVGRPHEEGFQLRFAGRLLAHRGDALGIDSGFGL